MIELKSMSVAVIDCLPFHDQSVSRRLLVLCPAQESACILMSPQQLIDTRTQGRVGLACLVEKAPELVGALAFQGFEKDCLGIGLCVAHRRSPLRFRQYSVTQCPVCGETRQEIRELSIGSWAGVLTQTGIKPGASIGPLALRRALR